jgi:hypothetical protein
LSTFPRSLPERISIVMMPSCQIPFLPRDWQWSEVEEKHQSPKSQGGGYYPATTQLKQWPELLRLQPDPHQNGESYREAFQFSLLINSRCSTKFFPFSGSFSLLLPYIIPGLLALVGALIPNSSIPRFMFQTTDFPIIPLISSGSLPRCSCLSSCSDSSYSTDAC